MKDDNSKEQLPENKMEDESDTIEKGTQEKPQDNDNQSTPGDKIIENTTNLIIIEIYPD